MQYESAGFVGRLQSDVMSKAAFGADYNTVFKAAGKDGEGKDKILEYLRGVTGQTTNIKAIQYAKSMFLDESTQGLLNSLGGDTGKTQLQLTAAGNETLTKMLLAINALAEKRNEKTLELASATRVYGI